MMKKNKKEEKINQNIANSKLFKIRVQEKFLINKRPTANPSILLVSSSSADIDLFTYSTLTVTRRTLREGVGERERKKG